MAIVFSASGQSAARVRADVLAVPVFAGAVLGPGAEVVDAALGGALGAFMTGAGFEGKPGQTLALPSGLPSKTALLVGLGDKPELTLDGLRRGAAAAARWAKTSPSLATTLGVAGTDAGLSAPEVAQALAEGLALGSYQFTVYKSAGKPSQLRRVTVLGLGAGSGVRGALERGAAIADAVSWARNLVNQPAAAKSPADLATAARRLLRDRGVTVSVLSGAELHRARLGGLLGVGQGSSRPPRFVKVVYNPRTRAAGRLALIGKGVVFDSGGLSLKPASGMETMKTDMSGAAAVLATMSVLRDLGVRTRVTAYVPLVENMPSGTAIRPGDVLKMRNGKTVEVLNTDAEGRLILADALAWAVDDRNDALIDLATLTGACMVALGDKIAGLMGNHDDWLGQVRAAADRVGEPVWPLPLPPEYKPLLDSEVADIKNVTSNGHGGALTAGLFLQNFVGEVPWVHMDIAGPARASSDDGYLVKGGTGFGVRTLVELVSNFRAPSPASAHAPAGRANSGRARRVSAR